VRGAIGTGKTSTLKAIAGYPGTRGDAALKRLRKWGRTQYIGGAAYYVAGYATVNEFLAAAVGREMGTIVWDLIEAKLQPATRESDPATLSGGQRHLLATVAALAGTEAPILCIDEPERGLDAEARRLVIAVAAARLKRGACILVASHDEPFIAALGAAGDSYAEVQVERA
jgi:ABC-type multidrug transport system ATPase subunit